MNSHPAHLQCAKVTDHSPRFCRQLVAAIENLKVRLQQKYTELFPELHRIVARALTEAEELAWETQFPHLLLPDLAEARLADLAPQQLLARAA
jgi:hypothetical protein